MYDILQLNDMLVPELLDIAEQLNIPDAKKTEKQDLIYKILDRQALAGGTSWRPELVYLESSVCNFLKINASLRNSVFIFTEHT